MQRFLITSGFCRLQEGKIKALNLAPVFTAIHANAIDEPNRIGKKGLFEKILALHKLLSSALPIVGNNADSEIEAGNQLGIKTVQPLRPDVPRASNATFHIHALDELKSLLTHPVNQ